MDEPKYQKLKNYIIDKIQQGKLITGDKIDSENVLSEKFNFSRHTVRHAIGELEKEGYLTRIKGSGTFVKSQYREKKQTIGVVTTYDDYVFKDIIHGIDQKLSQKQYTMMLGLTYNRVEKEIEVINNMIDRGVDGLIVETSKSALPNPNVEVYRKLHKRNIPFIFINGYYREIPCKRILLDDERGAYMAIEHFIKKGHRKIGGVFKVDDIQGHRRYLGFVKALRDYKIPLDEKLIEWFTTENMDDITSGRALLEKIKLATAVLAYNDETAIKINNLLKNANVIVGKDISMISFDDSRLAKLVGLDLTSVVYPAFDFGLEAAKRLIRMIEGEEVSEEKILKTKLIERASVVEI